MKFEEFSDKICTLQENYDCETLVAMLNELPNMDTIRLLSEKNLKEDFPDMMSLASAISYGKFEYDNNYYTYDDGAIQSVSEEEIVGMVDDYLEDLYEHPEIWEKQL